MKGGIMNKAERWHFTDPYILNPQHPVTVQVIGAGGSGSQVLTQLARIDQALKKLGHTGLHITCFDDDLVTDANLGRQLFSPADLGLNKSVVLITRLNQFFGTSWKAEARKFSSSVPKRERSANITISCVDSVNARKTILKLLYPKQGMVKRSYDIEPYEESYYWMDLGNGQHSGQFVIGSCQDIKQPKGNKEVKPIRKISNIFEKFPEFLDQKSKNAGPSCSLADALTRQDLFINSMLVQTAMATLWKMFREGKINHHGAFINLKTLNIAPIYL